MNQPQALDVRLIEWFDDHWYKVRYMDETKVEKEDYFASVTTKMGALAKPFLAHWRGSVGNVEADRVFMEGCDKGSRIHHAWYTYMEGGAVIYNPVRGIKPYEQEEIDALYKKHNGNVCVLSNQEDMLDAWKLQRMCQILKPKPAFNEHTLYDVDEKDAGTTDNIFDIEEGSYPGLAGAAALKLPKGRYIFDLKTGKSIEGADKQVGRYGVMAEKMGLGTIAGALIGHTGATTKTGIPGFKLVYINREEMLEANQRYLRIARVWDDEFKGAKPKVFQLPALITRNTQIDPNPPKPLTKEKKEAPKNVIA